MDKIVKSLARIFIEQALSPSPINEKLTVETGVVLYRKIKKMPLSLRALIYLSTYIFDWAGIFYRGRRFSLQNIEQQQKMLNAVQHCDGYPIQQFIRFYQKLSLYIYYSLIEVVR